MGHAKELITMDVYGDNTNIIPEEIPELLSYMDEVMPKKEAVGEDNVKDVSDIAVDVDEFLTKIRRSNNSAGNINPALFALSCIIKK